MANPEHIEILQQGIEVWNRWRKKNPGIKPDLSSACLEGAHLIYANFARTNLCFINLSSANLSHANLRNAHLSFAYLKEANMRGADWKNAVLCRTLFQRVNLSGSSNLDTVQHEGPSLIDWDTISLSEYKIPESFLRACEVSDEIIEAAREKRQFSF